MAKAKKLFTIGYEQTPATAVLDELQRAGVKLLVDVRAIASSRRPGFSKTQLAAGLDARGIGYVHLRGLGTPKNGRLAARSGDMEALSKIYHAHLKTQQARDELDELQALVMKAGSSPKSSRTAKPRKPRTSPPRSSELSTGSGNIFGRVHTAFPSRSLDERSPHSSNCLSNFT
jgi:hypothetical protein